MRRQGTDRRHRQHGFRTPSQTNLAGKASSIAGIHAPQQALITAKPGLRGTFAPRRNPTVHAEVAKLTIVTSRLGGREGSHRPIVCGDFCPNYTRPPGFGVDSSKCPSGRFRARRFDLLVLYFSPSSRHFGVPRQCLVKFWRGPLGRRFPSFLPHPLLIFPGSHSF